MTVNFIDNNNIKNNIDKYISISVDSTKIIKSWKESLFSYEWLLPDGKIKNMEDLPTDSQTKRKEIEDIIKNNKNIEKPVLGIGILENIEIGIGKDIFLTLTANNIQHIDVHIPKSHIEEFKKFLS